MKKKKRFFSELLAYSRKTLVQAVKNKLLEHFFQCCFSKAFKFLAKYVKKANVLVLCAF